MQDRDIELDFKDKYRYANEYWSPFLEDARVYTLAASGYTWSNQERQMLQKQGREPLELNIMRRPLQFFSGYLRDNINQVIYSPVEGSDQKTADQFTKLSYYIWDTGQGYPTFLDASTNALSLEFHFAVFRWTTAKTLSMEILLSSNVRTTRFYLILHSNQSI